MTIKTTIFLRGLAWLYASIWCPLRLKYLRLKIKLAPKIAGIAESCKDALLLIAYLIIMMFTILPWAITKLIAELIEILYDSIDAVLRRKLGYEAAASEVLSYMKQRATKADKLNQKTLVVKKNGTSENSEDRTLLERKVEQIASAQFRGMRVMHVVIKNNECYSVWRWSLTEHKFAQLIEILTKDGSINRRPNMDVKEGTWSRF